MINDILNSINAKISETFGSGYEIYNNELKQGFQEPCFFILQLKGGNELVIGNRYQRTHSFDVQYFPKSEKAVQEMNNVADILTEQLEYITVAENLIRGNNMSYEKIDNVLHFFINYDVFVLKQIDKLPLMETFEQTQHLKGE